MTKKDMEEMINIYKGQISFLEQRLKEEKEEKIALRDQVFRLQEGIMSIRSPQAYDDMKADQAGDPEVLGEASEEDKIRTQMELEHLKNIERPLFSSANDLGDLLEAMTIETTNTDPPSVHGNSES